MAHPYVDIEYLKSNRPEKKLIELFADKALPTDPEPTAVDNNILNPILLKASEEVDGYLRRRISVPLGSCPDTIKDHVCNLVIYYGHVRRGAVPEVIKQARKDSLDWLLNCSRGLVDPGIEPEPTANSTRQIGFTTQPRTFTKDGLLGL